MTATETSEALSSFQGFVQSGIPATLGGELILSKGTIPGNLGVQFMGVHWDDPATFNNTIAPYMSLFPEPDTSNVTSGDWITVLAAWAFGNLDTSTMAPYSDAFYAKSLLTPEKEGINKQAIDAFVNYLATDGFDSDVVSILAMVHCEGRLTNPCSRRPGSPRSSYTEEVTLRSTPFP